MATWQKGILEDVPEVSRYLTFSLIADTEPQASLERLGEAVDGSSIVVGIGKSLTTILGKDIEGLKSFPAYAATGMDIPSTPAALWCWLRGSDRGDLVNSTHMICDLLGDAFECEAILDGFKHGDGRDLTGYEDGTENPEGDDAVSVAFVTGQGQGMDGASFVAVQTWLHDLGYFNSMPSQTQDHIIGRRKSDNEELDEAPESAHVKRTAQEDFEPEAFLLRRSMPWADASGEGLQFIAFDHSFDSFEAQLKRMLGLDDGVSDALFRFTKPVSGAYFWCPPMKQDGSGLDLSALGIN